MGEGPWSYGSKIRLVKGNPIVLVRNKFQFIYVYSEVTQNFMLGVNV